jgi:hypothetical protein
MKFVMSLILLLALLVPNVGWANCGDDLPPLEERIKKRPTGDTALATKELRKAQEVQKYSETECLNAVIRAKRALALPAPPKPLDSAAQPPTRPPLPQ